MRRFQPIAFFSITFLFVGHIQGQLLKAPLDQRIRISELIVEGRVLYSESYWDTGHTNIYTSHLVEVSQTLKGVESELVEVVSIGGQVGGEALIVSHNLALAPGDFGILFLQRSSRYPAHFSDQISAWEVYAGPQGFISIMNNGGTDLFDRYMDVGQQVYSKIPGCMVSGPVVLQEVERGTSATAIDSIYPDTLSAGTRSSLFIRGTEFGVTKGKVRFLNADNGGMTKLDADSADIITWTDTLIEVWVPSVGPRENLTAGTAGSGPVEVETNGGATVQSADTFYVKYAINNGRDPNSGVSRYVYIPDTNTIGGLTLQYHPSFSDSLIARKLFEKSLRTWRCTTGVNFSIGADSAINSIAEDGVSSVRWNTPSDSLPFGVLARTFNRVKPCVEGNTLEFLYFLHEVDIVFKDTTDFYFDSILPPPPGTNKADFYTVALHELGHAHQLLHVIDKSSLMHYAVTGEDTTRYIPSFQLEGGQWIVDSSIVVHSFCPQPLIKVPFTDCNILNEMRAEADPIFPVQVFPVQSRYEVRIRFSVEPKDRFESLLVFDLDGKILTEINKIEPNRGLVEIRIPCLTFSSGMKIARIKTKMHTETVKFFIQ